MGSDALAQLGVATGAAAASGLRLSTADRSFGAALTGAVERGELRGPVRLDLRGAAGQSFGAFASSAVLTRNRRSCTLADWSRTGNRSALT